MVSGKLTGVMDGVRRSGGHRRGLFWGLGLLPDGAAKVGDGNDFGFGLAGTVPQAVQLGA